MKILKDAGLRDDTLVIFTTDHGQYLGAHGMIEKSRGLLGGIYQWTLFSFIDIVPTILDFLGVLEENGLPAIPCDGISQKARLQEKEEGRRKSLTANHTNSVLDTALADQQYIIVKHKIIEVSCREFSNSILNNALKFLRIG
ncbi:MAG: hypothetical protein PQJ58_06415 [Spirochaetales bacterium]|nr:hypothetical protein [Spirochaetales bacterium]